MNFNRNFLVNNSKKLYRQNGNFYLRGSLNDKRKQLYELIKLRNMIIYKHKEKLYNSYNPVYNNKKLLLLMATHVP